MSQRDQRNERGTTPIEERLLRRRVSRRTIMRAGAAGAAGIARPGHWLESAPRRSAATCCGMRAPALAGGDDRRPKGSTAAGCGWRPPASRQRSMVTSWHSGPSRLIGWNMFEALFTFDADYNTVPMLAEGIEVSDDGLTNTITLRQGVPFHNGEEMTRRRRGRLVQSLGAGEPVSVWPSRSSSTRSSRSIPTPSRSG